MERLTRRAIPLTGSVFFKLLFHPIATLKAARAAWSENVRRHRAYNLEQIARRRRGLPAAPLASDSARSRLTERWTSLQILKAYQELRKWIRPAIGKIIRKHLAGSLTPEAVILEIGAGGGEMRRLVGQRLAKRIKDVFWIESDQTLIFLQQKRNLPPEAQTVAQLPILPLRDQAVSSVVGLGVLDTIPLAQLQQVLTEIFRVLLPGGRLIHFLDLQPNWFVEVVAAAQKGRLPFPYYRDVYVTELDQKVRVLSGVRYVDSEEAGQKIVSIGLASFSIVWWRYLENPPKVANQFHLPNVGTPAPHMLWRIGEVLDREGLVKEIEPSLPSLFHRRLTEAAKAAGFEIEYADEVTETVDVSERRVPKLPPGKNVIFFWNGNLYMGSNSAVPPGKVRIIATILRFSARRPKVSALQSHQPGTAMHWVSEAFFAPISDFLAFLKDFFLGEADPEAFQKVESQIRLFVESQKERLGNLEVRAVSGGRRSADPKSRLRRGELGRWYPYETVEGKHIITLVLREGLSYPAMKRAGFHELFHALYSILHPDSEAEPQDWWEKLPWIGAKLSQRFRVEKTVVRDAANAMRLMDAWGRGVIPRTAEAVREAAKEPFPNMDSTMLNSLIMHFADPPTQQEANRFRAGLLTGLPAAA